jgi:hypothetical protein
MLDVQSCNTTTVLLLLVLCIVLLLLFTSTYTYEKRLYSSIASDENIKTQAITDGRSNLGRAIGHENRAKHTKRMLDNFGDKFDVI